jgi:glucose-1-phosphate thymidylyltransferase
MTAALKIVIPTAGWATRMRPQTWSKPKPLVSVAGKTVIDHLLDSFRTITERMPVEYVIIYSPGLGETQIPPYMREHHPDLKVSYVLQPEMKGQSHALWLAREHLTGPMVMCFSDTLIEADFSFLTKEKEAVVWVKSVPDPRRFGVAELKPDGHVKRLLEKPPTIENDLAMVGCYYFPGGEALITAIEEQMKRNVHLKGEFFLADAVNILLEQGSLMRPERIETWLDTGTISATLETNAYMLDHGCDNSLEAAKRPGMTVLPPVFIHPGGAVEGSVIGPHVSVGAGCEVRGSVIRNSILEDGAIVTDSVLSGSFIGRQARVEGRASAVNIGDNSSLIL